MNQDAKYSSLSRYAAALENIRQDATEQELIEVLTARDALQLTLIEEEKTEKFGDLLLETSSLDSRLQTHGALIAAKVDLPSLRAVRNPAADAWWWHFEPPAPKKVDIWDRFDWLFSGVMAGALAMSASLMMQIFQAFSIGGMSLGETFATIAQGGGLALISSGALTESGRRKVDKIMANIGIQRKYLAEVLCLVSLVLLVAVYSLHSHLPDYFYKKGIEAYQNSDLADAAFKFQQAMSINSDDERFNLELGKVYESMGDLEQALAQYKIVAETGNPWGLNNLARVLFFSDQYVLSEPYVKEPVLLAESYLRLALQRALVLAEDAETDDVHNLLYQIYRNLGGALLTQKKYDQALPYLTKAIELDQTITDDQIGGGMAYCLLSYVQKQLQQQDSAKKNWQICLVKARPETILEYKWFIDAGLDHSVERIYTTSIVGGITEEQFKNLLAKEKAASNKPFGTAEEEQQ